MSRLKLALPSGLATAVGALPGVPAAQAAKLIGDWLPMLRSAPTLDPLFESEDSQSDSPERDSSLRQFLESLGTSSNPVSLSVVGPITTQLRLLSEGTERAIAEKSALNAVRARIDEMLEIARETIPGASLLVMLEEPALANSMHPTFPFTPDEIERQIRRTFYRSDEDVVDISDGDDDAPLYGVHVNGRADWAMLIRTGISVLGAPVTGRLETAADEIQAFLADGGFIAWGAVPTDEPLGSNSDRLWRRLSDVWASLTCMGLDPMLLREQSIITPSAELANFGLAQAEQIIRLTVQISERVTRQISGARISIGA